MRIFRALFVFLALAVPASAQYSPFNEPVQLTLGGTSTLGGVMMVTGTMGGPGVLAVSPSNVIPFPIPTTVASSSASPVYTYQINSSGGGGGGSSSVTGTVTALPSGTTTVTGTVTALGSSTNINVVALPPVSGTVTAIPSGTTPISMAGQLFTLQNNATTTGAGTSMTVMGYAGGSFIVTGAFSGLSMVFEGSTDGVNWFGLLPLDTPTNATQGTTNAPGVFPIAFEGLTFIRARIASITSGSVTAQFYASNASSTVKSLLYGSENGGPVPVQVNPFGVLVTTNALAGGDNEAWSTLADFGWGNGNTGPLCNTTMLFNGSTYDRARGGMTGGTNSAMGFQNVIPEGVYHATPQTFSDGQFMGLQSDSNGYLKVNTGAVAISNTGFNIGGAVALSNTGFNVGVTFPATQAVSASSLPLPTGAATSALQSAIVASESNIQISASTIATNSALAATASNQVVANTTASNSYITLGNISGTMGSLATGAMQSTLIALSSSANALLATLASGTALELNAMTGGTLNSITGTSSMVTPNGFARNPGSSFNRPANTLTYSVGSVVTSSTGTTGGAIPIYNIARAAGQGARIEKLDIYSTNPSMVNASFQLYVFNSNPGLSATDGQVILTSGSMSNVDISNCLGYFAVTLTTSGSNGAVGRAIPDTGTGMTVSSTNNTIYVIPVCTAAYGGVSSETLTIVPELATP